MSTNDDDWISPKTADATKSQIKTRLPKCSGGDKSVEHDGPVFQRWRRKQRCRTKRNFHTEPRRNEIQTYHRITTPVSGVPCGGVQSNYRNIVRVCASRGWWYGVGVRRRGSGRTTTGRPFGRGGEHGRERIHKNKKEEKTKPTAK